MTINGDTYFWQRSPRWLNRLVAYSLGPAAVVALIVGALGGAAQRRSASLGAAEGYSLTQHVIAMTVLAALAVGIASALVRLRRVELAGVVLLAVAAGPMLLVAAPVSDSVVNAAGTNTTAGWHSLVAVALVAVMTGWTALVVRCLAERDRVMDVQVARSPAPWQWADLLFVAAALAGVLVFMVMPVQANEPSMIAIAGWALLAAGSTVVACYSASPRVLAALIASTGGTLLVLVVAYGRSGGWPGVAGWEGDLQSPIITSIASSAFLLCAPIVGFGIGAASRALLRRRTHSPSRVPLLAAG